MKTEEEKEKARMYAKKYYLANKEKIAAYQKEFNAKNAERIAARSKEYHKTYLRNEESQSKNKAQQKIYRRNTREHRAVITKAYRESFQDGLFTVYILPKENYVGQTDCYPLRIKNHKSLGKDITDAKVLGKYKTREEALAIEASYHAKGYNGWNYGI
jgi:hypothetical protein